MSRLVTSLVAMALVALVACGDDPPAKDPSTATTKDSKDPKDTKDSADKGGTSGSGKSELNCKGKPEIGKNASTFSLPGLNGGKTQLDKGKVYVVDFWATWCEPCKKSFPKYQELYVKYKASGLEIVAVSVDDEKKDIPDFIKSFGAKFPVGWDEGHKVADCFKPPGMPSAFVIDKNGVVKYVHNGFREGEEKDLEKEIKGLL